jgi:hypothetical protein
MLLCCFFINRRIGEVGSVAAEVLCLPDKVLDKVALVLGE